MTMIPHHKIPADIAMLHREVPYWCRNGHCTTRTWSAGVEVPALWECPRCGLPAGRDRDHPPPPARIQPFKSPLTHLMERRTEAECEALLAETLTTLRAQRRGRRR